MLKGHKMTEEHKKSISEAHKAKGILHWSKRPEVKEKMRQAKFKNPMKYWLGKERSKETKDKISKFRRENPRDVTKCNFWKGGINKLSWAIRKCWKYKEWRSNVFERDNYTCQDCGKIGEKISAHHIISFSRLLKENNIKSLEQAINSEQLWNLNNGMTLCVECHKKTKSYLGGKIKDNY